MASSDSKASFNGQLGQTTRRSYMIAADDGSMHPVELLVSVDVDADPDLLEELESGAALRVERPDSGEAIEVAQPVALHDPKRRTFALLLPESLRHEAVARRSALLAELAKESVTLPAYVTEPKVLFSVDAFRKLEGPANADSDADSNAGSDGSAESADPASELEASKELARQRAALQAEKEQLEIEKAQLDEVRDRFDKERARMDEIEESLQSEREKISAEKEELERQRSALKAQELNLEQQKISEAQGTDYKPNSSDATQVVTDDQFIEIAADDDEEESLEAISDADIEEMEIEDVKMTPLTDGVPRNYDDVISGDRDRAVKIKNDELLAVYRGPKEKISSLFTKQDSPGFFVQLHRVESYPIIAITLALLDEDEQPVESVAWPLDIADQSDVMLLDKLEKETALRVGLYNDNTGTLLRAVNVEAPLDRNIHWIRERATEALEDATNEGATFADSVSSFLDDDFELIGPMRHNFTVDSFEKADSPSELKLASGIVEYWSDGDVFEHLVANRSFPLHHFRAIQERIVRRAVEFGIWFGPALRNRALELGLAEDEHALCERLIANFAETSVSLRNNDLDPIAQWENWDNLLALSEEVGVPADNDVVELAEASLKRAREFEEMQQSGAKEIPGAESTVVTDAPLGMREDKLVIAKTSEATGVTYFLPDDAVLDTFEDLESMSREDLELLLSDGSGRLEAAQMLLERFGSEAAERALATADEMNAPEVAALARFMEGRAKGMEAELVRTVESGGPSSVYVATRSLAASRSSTAIPAVLDALDDDARRGDARRLTAAVAFYGEKLLPELRRVIKRDGPKETWVALLREVERHAPGTIDDFARDRSKSLREAAQEVKS